MAGLWAFLNSTPVVIAFYVAVFLFIYLKRDRFEIEAKIIALYRTRIGIGWINSFAERHGKAIKRTARLMIWPAYLLMILICVYLFITAVNLFARPQAAGGVGLVLPGVKVPGSPIVLPLWHGILSIFIVATVHEASHGIVAAAHKLGISSTGVFLMGPIPGAFVEPDEKNLRKSPHDVQTAIFAAGPMSNMVLALIFFGALFGTSALWMDAARPHVLGVEFLGVDINRSAHTAGINPRVIFTHANGRRLYSTDDLISVLEQLCPGDTLELVSETGSRYSAVLGEHPEKWAAAGYSGLKKWMLDRIAPASLSESTDAADYTGIRGWLVGWLTRGGARKSPGYLGIRGMAIELERVTGLERFKMGFIDWWHDLFLWIVILSSGIGLVNLLPIGPVDGGRMLQLVTRHRFGERRGDAIWRKVSTAFLVLLAINILIPMLRVFVNGLIFPLVRIALNASVA